MHSFAISKYLFVKKSAISSISLTNVKKDSSQLNCLINLSNIINVFYLQNVIHEPTRINQNTGNGTLLDPVLISADCNVTFSEVIDVCREKGFAKAIGLPQENDIPRKIKLYNLEIRFLPKSFHHFQILNLLFFLLLMFQRYKLKLLHQNSFYLR
jgi:hypothetical protein